MPPTPDAWLQTLDTGLRGALLALLLMLGASMLRWPRRLPLEQVGLALAAGLCVQVVMQAPAIEWGPWSPWQAPAIGIAMGNSVLFWLFALALCDDDFVPRWRHGAAWGGVVLAATLNLVLLVPWCRAGGPGWATLASQVVFATPLLFGLLTVWAAARHWRDDLIEPRRYLRAAIVVGGSAYALAMVAARRASGDGRLTPQAAVFDVAALLLIVAAVAWLLLRPVRGPWYVGKDIRPSASPARARPGEQSVASVAPADAPARSTEEDAADTRLAQALDRTMQVERAYKDPTLSVGGLADRLGVPEYRLRRHINQRLGHRNFNAYLNAYRLAEAQAALADPVRRQLPVLTIALEAGFGSIGPFNRAFKADTGLTPTDFRRQRLADS
ncbi:MAG: helix-turn-helix transcriptional regulator [Rubrivivax sp.]|nr:helix-turn-helix transcriptional regulator [Rubrivivax sp.]